MFKKYIHKDKARALRVQALRRSNAATPIPNKKKYTRNIRHLWNRRLRSETPDSLD